VSKARQEDLNGAMVSILKKMDAMLDTVNETYQEQLLVLNRVDAVQTNSVAVELKKQTTLLTSIEAKIAAGKNGGGEGDEISKESIKAFGQVGKIIERLIKATSKLDEGAGERIKSFLTKTGEGLQIFLDSVDVAKSNAIMELMTTLTRGVIFFALAMIIATPLLVLAIPGIVLFGLSVRLLMWTAGDAAKEGAGAMDGVMALGKGAVLYALSMIVVTILAPAVLVGSAVLGLSIRLLLTLAGATAKEGAGKLDSVLALAQGAVLYALAMLVVTILAPVVLIGTVILGLSIRLLMWTSGAASKEGAGAMNGVLALAKGALLYSLAMILVTLLAPIVLIGSIVLGLSFRVIGWGFKSLANKNVLLGLVALGGIILGVLLLAMTMAYFQQTVEWEGLLKVGATIGGLAIMLYIAGKFFIDILKGTLAMAAASIALILISTGVAIFKSANVTWEDLGMLAATIGGLALIGAIAGIGPVPVFIALGSAALIVASISVILIATAMNIWMAANVKMEDALALGATIGMLGVEMALFGLASPLILLGSAAMMVAGVALLPITLGLVAFKASGFMKPDADNLEYALGSVVNGFLGGKMPGGIIEGIKFAAGAAARAALLFVTVPPMILAGMALLPITAALSIFKKSGFTTSDADNLEYMIGSVVRSFGIVTDYDRQKKMGFYVNPWDLFVGIQALSGAGRVLGGLAQGIQAWAKMEVNEWEVINPGTKDAQLVIKNRRKLNEGDFDAAAYGMAKVISAIAKPFADVGKLEKGKSSGNPLLDAVFGGGFVSGGIKALSKSGDTLVALAQGVQAFANMEITEYEVVGAGTADAKLVPKDRRRLSDTEIKAAGNNIATIIGVVAKEFAKIGEAEKNSSGIFSGGYVSKGVKALAGIGDTVSQITEAVIKFATGEIPTFTLVNEGTPDQKLVPGLPKKLTRSMMVSAAFSIGKILRVIGSEVSVFGDWISGKKKSIEIANEYSVKISDVVNKSVDSIKKWVDVDVQSSTDKISLYFTAIRDLFDPSKNPELPKTAWYFSKFATNIELVKKNADGLDRVATNFDKIEKSMKLIGQHINSLDLKKLTLTDSMFTALAAMSKNPDAIAKMVGKTMDKSFEELIKALKELAENSKPTGSPGPVPGSGPGPVPGSVPKSTPPTTPAPPTPPQTTKEQGVRINNIQELALAISRAMPG